MILSRLRVSFVLAICVAGVASVGCSRQLEGERCSLANGDADCEGNLVCTDHNKLRREDGIDRCCPEDLGSTDTIECAPKTNSGGNGDGDTDGAGGESSMGGSDPGTTGSGPDLGLGDGCDYASDCEEPLVCGPGGQCQHECKLDRDCDSGEICSAEFSCVDK